MNRNTIIYSYGALLSLIILLSSCSSPLQNIGRTVKQDMAIDYAMTEGKEQTWQTGELAMTYTIDSSDGSPIISGSVVILDRVLNSYPVARFLNVYINLLDGDGTATSMIDLGLLVPAYSQVSEPIPFRKQFPKDPGTTSYTFSYWGTFRESALVIGDVDELDVYHNPF